VEFFCVCFVGLLVMELFWLVLGLVWVAVNYEVCFDLVTFKRILFGNLHCCNVYNFVF